MIKVFATLFLLGAAASAYASEFGCKVLLCLANPTSNGGPKGVAECEQPINQLYRDLSKGRPFPSCDMEDGNDGSSYARQIDDPYDPCPTPLQPAARGAYVGLGLRKAGDSIAGWWDGSSSYTLTGQPQVSEPQNDSGHSSGSRACVGKLVGTYTVGGADNSHTVNLYDRVSWQPAQNPRAIDVYIDGKWYKRVR